MLSSGGERLVIEVGGLNRAMRIEEQDKPTQGFRNVNMDYLVSIKNIN
jgi:hypothetical protein